MDKRMADYATIADAIDYIYQHKSVQPSLADVASHVGMSPSHLQRTFTRWAGVSPKRFLQYLTLEHAKTLLDKSKPVLEAAYDAGLSGPGRLHDLFVTVEGVTPGEYKTGGAGLTIEYGWHATPFGECLLAVTERGVCGLSFLKGSSLNGGGLDEALADLNAQWPGAMFVESASVTGSIVDRIFSRAKKDGDRRLSLYLTGTNFQLKVWEALLKIPPGAVSAYGDVAEMIDSPSASRAVGSAIGSNLIAYLIPCHRVIRSSGALSNYRWGVTRKRAILGWEAAQVDLAQATD